MSVLVLLTSCKPITSDVPSFNLLFVDSTTTYNTNNIPDGKPIVLLYFSADCDHCQRETEGILQKMDFFKQIQLCFITTDPFDRMQVFNHHYKIDKYPNIILGRDVNFSYAKYIKYKTPPYLVIYDKHKQQRAVFAGEAKTDQIINLIKSL
jgi:hypothetical protein